MLKYLLFLPLFSIAQIQQGETCLFTCAYHISHTCSVIEYEYDFSRYVGCEQDYERDGARSTVAQIVGWLSTEFVIVNQDMLTALDHGNAIMTMLWVEDDENGRYCHEIVIEGYTGKGNDPLDIELIFYNPEYGRHEKMRMFDFVVSEPLYAITIKK